MKKNKLIYLIILSCIFSAEPINHTSNSPSRNEFLEDRAKGYLLKGKAKTAITNYGNFITWDHQPAGLWNNFTYFPHLGFITGIPGHEYSSKWSTVSYQSWVLENVTIGAETVEVWASLDAYSAWVDDIADPETGEGNFKTVVYNTIDDRGNIATERNFIAEIVPDGDPQWVLDSDSEKIYLYLDDLSLDPNYASSLIGLAYPWAIRPQFVERTDEYDIYEYGNDEEAWTDDDEYVYYGANTNESWFNRDVNSSNTDWQAVKDASYNSFNSEVTAGEIFGEIPFVDPFDPEHLLAHSEYPSTWPEKYDIDSGTFESFWPGWWADEYYGDVPEQWAELGINDCDQTWFDDDCWKPLQGKHISDMDVYMEFDDRWASLGNQILDNQYEATGYPMGLKVKSMSHSYGYALTEDVLFFTLTIRNESGDFCAFEKNKYGLAIPVFDNNGNVICDEGMIMPDGTKLNRGAGFDYKRISTGFYMDADVLSADAAGSFNVHTNDDDFMYYIDCMMSSVIYPDGCPEVNGVPLRISMAVIGDYDGYSNSATGYSMGTGQTLGSDFGVVAVQLLDSPYATDPVDLDLDGFIDIFPGERLQMTDWHWFDWYNRPGVVSTESNSNCCAGNPGVPQALNKEEIQYKVMAGDNTNLTAGEKERYFHTANPNADLDSELNPHFDSLEGLTETSFFQSGIDGLDCVLEMTTGPFDLEVGEQVNLSFVVLFGENIEDLKENAKNAQILYNNHYFMPPSPSIPSPPELTVTSGTYSVALSWDDSAESSIDYLTETADFQGYRIYRSLDGGETWGDILYNLDGHQVGWQPLIQFDLDDDISGTDPLAPWVGLGDNTGLQYTFTDAGLFVYNDHCYAVTAYDSGLEPGDYDDQWYDFSGGFPSLESSINANTICVSLPMPDIYNTPADVLFEASELNIGISNIEYIVHNDEISGLFKFEIQADLDLETYLSSPILNPELYVYEVDTLGNLISTISYQVTELSESELDSLLDMPGADLDSINDIIYLPDYIASEFPIYSIDQNEFENNYLDVLGMYVKNQNYNHLIPNGNHVPIKDIIYSDESLTERVKIMMRYKANLTEYFQRPYFDYKIEFSTTVMDTAYKVGPVSACNHMPNDINTPLPFKITNTTLDQDVLLWHVDKGIEEGLIQYNELYSGSCDGCYDFDEICVFDQCIERTGYKNCSWERNEILHFSDIIYTTNDPDGDDEKFYELLIYPDVNKYFEYVGVDSSEIETWNENDSYSAGEIVLHEGMLWELTEFATTSNHPDLWYDENGDYINDSPWQMLYPWEDGDYIEIITPKMLHDGDSWLIDMSKIGDCSANLGNVNDDEYINILDVVRIINVIVGNAEFDTNSTCTADLNQDGIVNILDVVQLVNMIMGYDGDFLSRSDSSKHLDISLSENLIRISSDEAFGGLQLNTGGKYSITETQIPEGIELYIGPKGIIIINLTGSTQKSDIVISYQGEMRIIDHLASDLYGNTISSRIIGIPMEYSFNNAYPNPFNPVTTISYGLPLDGHVKLVIYDLLGRQVDILYNDIQHAGYHHINWNASSYASGMYFVQLIAADFVKTQKLMLVK